MPQVGLRYDKEPLLSQPSPHARGPPCVAVAGDGSHADEPEV